MNYELVVKNIQDDLRQYITSNNMKSLVIGVSGGIDSTFCCALAYPICQELKVPLIGVSIPIETNKPDEIQQAKEVGAAFCDKFMEANLTSFYEHERDFLWSRIAVVLAGDISKLTNIQVKIADGNLKARARMRLLYFVAGITGGMVLSTDNKTELNLGFWTIHGDVGDYGMIQNLWKTEVYKLANYLRLGYSLAADPSVWEKAKILEDGIKAVPTDGLGVTNSDFDQLGASTYDEVDRILQTWMEKKEGWESLKDHPVVQRHIKSEFKRNNPYNISRENLFKGSC